MRFTKRVGGLALSAILFGAIGLAAQARTGDSCLSIKAATPQGFTTLFFAAKKKATEAEVQKCIEDKLKGGALKDDGITVKVSNGVATLEGKTSVPGHKGGATQIAKGCGAQKVTNNITVTGGSKPAKPSPSPKK